MRLDNVAVNGVLTEEEDGRLLICIVIVSCCLYVNKLLMRMIIVADIS